MRNWVLPRRGVGGLVVASVISIMLLSFVAGRMLTFTASYVKCVHGTGSAMIPPHFIFSVHCTDMVC
jgi:hypothetical protein